MSQQGSRNTTPSPGLSMIDYTENYPLHFIPVRPVTPRFEGSHCKNCIQYMEHIKQLQQHIDRVHEENRRLNSNNRTIRETYGRYYSRAEHEEEYVSNLLLKRIQKLKEEKEVIAQKYEQEEEHIAINLMKRMREVQAERDNVKKEMKKEQTEQMDAMMKNIRKTETELEETRKVLDRMRREKIDQENALETEQEMLYNTLGKQLDQLNTDKKGYVDNEDNIDVRGGPSGVPSPIPAVVAEEVRPPSTFTAEAHQAEMSKLVMVASERIRALEETIASLTKEKEAFCGYMDEMRRSFSDRFDGCLTPSGSSNYVMESNDVREYSMGPPSVPPTPRPAIDSVSDMDDASSRGSHRDD
ncbi:unnamed protein product, partial [Mesorhabditis spiculigera]